MQLALLAVGTAFSAIGAIQQGQAANSAAKYNAAVAGQRATAAKQQAAADMDKKRRDTVRRLGSIRAAYGASGVTLEGSPLDVLAESAANAELDVLTIKYKGDLEATGYGNEATLETARGQQARTAGYMGAGAALLTGVDKYLDR